MDPNREKALDLAVTQIERQFGKTVYPREFGTALLRTVIEREDLTLDGDRVLGCGGQNTTGSKKS